jgi:D-alanyl-D-alanine dipeptidase
MQMPVHKISWALMLALVFTTEMEAGTSEPTLASKKAVFVDIKDVDPTIVVDARYATELNFTGKVVPGYKAPKCLLTLEAAQALAKAQAVLKPMGLRLKTYDCYRPQEAVTAFMVWANSKDNPHLKRFYYPAEQIEKLFERGYIAERSGHSRGSTVDLTIVPIATNKVLNGSARGTCTDVKLAYDQDGSLNMGTSFDCFDEKSSTANEKVAPASRANRLLLKTIMEQAGFKNYEKEWWHYTLINEPFPDRYFTESVH